MTRFAIVDIETTGGHYRYAKITEIAIIVMENGEIVERFESLVNPECNIPPEITRITGITSEMVENAPRFYEIAKKIIELTHDSVFVAHNVQFDYSFIKEEFKNLGFNFSRKKLCTVLLSRKYFPGLRSYSLGNLIRHFGIEVVNRHRAFDDAWATLQIFKKMLENQGAEDQGMSHFLKGAIKESKLPPQLTQELIGNLPEECGVYYMCDKDGEYVYIGKSIRIKDRIIQHFNDSGPKSSRMVHKVHSIEYKLTGSELMASLLESRHIKDFQPEINRAQRFKSESYAIVREQNDRGYYVYQVRHKDQLSEKAEAIQLFSNSRKASDYLDYLIYQYELCEGVQSDRLEHNRPCNRKQIGLCRGACTGLETLEEYNERFDAMHQKVNRFFTEDFILIDTGRDKNEKSIIVIEDGFCTYYGYVSDEEPVTDLHSLKSQLEPYRGNIESNGIILNYLKKNPRVKKIPLSHWIEKANR
jgi:DNA polymerase-3 subunit epsilon